jgi:hypothetical protein
MAQFPTNHSRLLTRACRFACLIALGALLAGCDKCGDWFWSHSDQPQVCRQQAPKPQ